MKKLAILSLFLSSSLFAVFPPPPNPAVNLSTPLLTVVNGFLTGFSPNSLELAMDGFGNSLAVWSVFNGSTTVLQAAFKPAGGTWTTQGSPLIQASTLSTIGYNVTGFQLAMDLSGNAIVVWQIINSNGQTVIQAAYKAFGKPLIAPGNPDVTANNLSPPGFEVTNTPAIAINGGNAVVAWLISTAGSLTIPFNTVNVVQAAYRPSGSTSWVTPGSPLTQIPGAPTSVLSPTPFFFNVSSDPLVAIDALGNAAVVWTIYNGTTINGVTTIGTTVVQGVFNSVFAALWLPAGNPSYQANILSPLNLNVVTNSVEVEVQNANASVVWIANNGISNIAQGI